MYSFYRTLTYVTSPFAPLLLKRRLRQGKEDPARVQERLGYASRPREEGKLLWIHAASVGEANSILPVIEKILEQAPALQILLTTVTVTSAALMQSRLPPRVIHQFAPLDIPSAVMRFLVHWKPDIAVWVDSEIWPNLIMQTKKSGAVMGIINARMSVRSFRRWKRFASSLMRSVLRVFTFCFAQSADDATRLRELGLKAQPQLGNLKYDALPLQCDPHALEQIKGQIAGRPVWLAACTHPGEEGMIARVHGELKESFPDLLTLVVPRHASRGHDIVKQLAPLPVAQRSRGQAITPEVEFYLADTMGELGLFYRLAPIVFIGGSLVPHGGQNPLEAARLDCAILMGKHMDNFLDIVHNMHLDRACLVVANPKALTIVLRDLLRSPVTVRDFQKNAITHMSKQSGVLAHIMNELRPYWG